MFGYITKVYHSGYGSERDIYLSSCINLILETEKLDIYVVLYNGVSRLVQKSSVTFDEIDPFYKADLTCTNAPGKLKSFSPIHPYLEMCPGISSVVYLML